MIKRKSWLDEFKSYLLKYFLFDNDGNLIDFDRNIKEAISLRKENNLLV